jgi:membrane peptidoglycan carboxypeptidase
MPVVPPSSGFPGGGGLPPGGNGPGGNGAGGNGFPPDEQPPRGYNPGQGRRQPSQPAQRKKNLINYPRATATGWTRWLPSIRLIALLFVLGVLTVIAAIFVIYQSISLPAPDSKINAQTTIIYYGDGENEIARMATQDREIIELAQVPVDVQHAVLAAEDHTFYTNSGVDPKSIARALINNVRGNATQGGSTVSQQYVKNVYNQRDRSFKRKFTEVFQAIKVNRQIKKDDILARYLNTIYMGRGAYGLQAASHAYFGQNTDAKDLTVSQGAFLAGIINAPSLADPRDGATEAARAERRWNVVLDAMVTDGWLDAQTRQKQKFPKTIKPVSQTSVKGQNAYLKEMVEEEAAKDAHLTQSQLETGGYKIVTTFNKNWVNAAAKAVHDKIPKDAPKNLRVGLAAIDPKTGAIKAIYGGKNINTEENQATKDRSLAGSTFKGFCLIAALEDGVSLKTYYDASSPHYFKGYKKPVVNYGGEGSGYHDLIDSIKHSYNTVYVQLNHDVGEHKTTAAAIAAGIPKDTPNLKDNLVNVLGSANVHPVDLASAYGTFASGGIRQKPYSVVSVSEIGTGVVKYKHPDSKGNRVFSADSVYDLTYALQQVVKGGTAHYAGDNLGGRPAAGKTGTADQSKAAWFVGYTPQLVASVGMHQETRVKSRDKHGKLLKDKNGDQIWHIRIDPISAMGGISNAGLAGGTFPTEIWTEFMNIALDGKPKLDFHDPVYGGEPLHSRPAPPPTVAPTATPQPTGQPVPTDTSQPTATDTPNPGPTFPPQTQPPAEPTTDPAQAGPAPQ